MFAKNDSAQLALFGGPKLFATPKSTSNLLDPDLDKFLGYSRAFVEAKWYTNNGPNVRLLEARLAVFHDVPYALTFSSGFWALALAMRTLALAGRTEVIMPSLTYRRMADIAAWIPLKPRFCEVDPQTLAMTPDSVHACLGENTALILGVHPIVNGCDASALVDLARAASVPILFDSVESVYEVLPEGRIGTFGAAECFSLHACKLLNGFGGGYLTTNDAELYGRLKSLRTFGFAGEDHIEFAHGLNAKLNEMHACLALASLDGLEAQIALNRERYYTYRAELRDLPGIRLLEFDERYRTGFKNIVAEFTNAWPLTRDETVRVLNAENILARPYYDPPLHRKDMRFEYVPAELPLTDRLAKRFVNLPCGQRVTVEDIRAIATCLRFIRTNAASIRERLAVGL